MITATCPGRGAALFALLRRAGTHSGAKNAWTPDQQRTASRCAASGARQALVTSNPPPRPFPIGIAQPALEYLAGVLAWQIGMNFDVLWHLVVGERGLELRADNSDIQRHPCLRFHHGHQRLTEFVVGNPEHRAVVYPGDRMQRGFDFSRIDVDAARDHHVALAVADEDIAVFIEIADIARGDEPVALDLDALLRLVVIGEIRIVRD